MKNKTISIKFKNDDGLQTLKVHMRLFNLIRQYSYDIKKSNTDVLLVVDGREGGGKSFGLRQIALLFKLCLKKYSNIDVSFTSKNIHYNVDDYINASYEHKDEVGWINVMDEAGDEIDRAGSTSKENKRYVRYIKKARFRRQIHIVALPKAHELSKYIAISRAKIIIHVDWKYIKSKDSPTGLEQAKGFYRVIDVEGDSTNKWAYYYNYNKFYQYPPIKKGDLVSRFDDCEVLSAAEIKQLDTKKQEMAEKFDKEDQKERQLSKKELGKLILAINPDAKKTDIAKMIKTSAPNLY